MALLRPNKGAAPATGKVKLSRAELLMSATQALATEQVPDAHTMTAIEGEGDGAGRNAALALPSVASSLSNDGQTARSVDHSAEGASTDQTARAAVSESASESATASGTAASSRTSAPPSSEASPSSEAPPIGSASGSTTGATTGSKTIEVRDVAVETIGPSPFQPRGRPSVAAIGSVRQAIDDAGSLEALVSPDGAPRFARLTPEAARLAELAYDVAEHGLKVPVEVRTIQNDRLECLSGHRRLAAAALAGLAVVPVIDRGAMSNAAAAATVLRGNLHRENFTTWQEATLITEVQERRRADGFRDNVRTLGTVMGWSHGKVNMLLRIRRALPAELLARVGDGDSAAVEEQIARAPYRDLERLASEPDDERRLAATRRLLGLGQATATAPRERARCTHRPKRGGGFVIEVTEPVETLDADDATRLQTYLETQLARVHARLRTIGH